MGMLRSEIPPEITEYQEKWFFGLTVRQLICAILGAILIIPTAVWGGKIMSSDILGWIIIIEVIPIYLIGWFKYNDMPVEIIGKDILLYYFCKQKRHSEYLPPVYNTIVKISDFYYEEEIEELKREQEEFKALKKTKAYKLEQKQKRDAKKKKRKRLLKITKKFMKKQRKLKSKAENKNKKSKKSKFPTGELAKNRNSPVGNFERKI